MKNSFPDSHLTQVNLSSKCYDSSIRKPTFLIKLRSYSNDKIRKPTFLIKLRSYSNDTI